MWTTGRNEEKRATQARIGELAAIAERELVDDPAAAATALLEGFELGQPVRRHHAPKPDREQGGSWRSSSRQYFHPRRGPPGGAPEEDRGQRRYTRRTP